MKIYLGKSGLQNSWQEDFPPTIKCHACKKEARILFVGQEFNEKKYICDLHDNKGEGNYWFHDAMAVALYLCRSCFEPTAIVNQA